MILASYNTHIILQQVVKNAIPLVLHYSENKHRFFFFTNRIWHSESSFLENVTFAILYLENFNIIIWNLVLLLDFFKKKSRQSGNLLTNIRKNWFTLKMSTLKVYFGLVDRLSHFEIKIATYKNLQNSGALDE